MFPVPGTITKDNATCPWSGAEAVTSPFPGMVCSATFMSCQLPLPFWRFYVLLRQCGFFVLCLMISHLCSEMGLKDSNLPVSPLFVLYFFFVISHSYVFSCLQTKITVITVIRSLKKLQRLRWKHFQSEEIVIISPEKLPHTVMWIYDRSKGALAIVSPHIAPILCFLSFPC